MTRIITKNLDKIFSVLGIISTNHTLGQRILSHDIMILLTGYYELRERNKLYTQFLGLNTQSGFHINVKGVFSYIDTKRFESGMVDFK